MCALCRRGDVPRDRRITWNTILRVVFFSLSSLHPSKEYFNLSTDIYLFISQHAATFSTLKHCLLRPQTPLTRSQDETTGVEEGNDRRPQPLKVVQDRIPCLRRQRLLADGGQQ